MKNTRQVKIQQKKRILVAPLNWGLGHATRCIPIIRALITHQFEPIIASDGVALQLLIKEFPDLDYIALPSYHITYPKNGKFFKLKMFWSTPKLLKAIKAENHMVKAIIKSHDIQGIISDNRFGVYHDTLPSVFITHQLQVLSGNTTWLSTKLHQRIIKRFNECWVPDTVGDTNLSGKLSHTRNAELPVKFIGCLSRFKQTECSITYNVMVLISGPEPQRTCIETKLRSEFKNFGGKVLFVRGVVEKVCKVSEERNMTVYNYMTSSQLETAINESELIVSRSGYTTIMDLARMRKKAFFIPTPGQFEQEYLAERLTRLGYVASCKQGDFSLSCLEDIANTKGLSPVDHDLNYAALFGLF
ncbi:MAG: glycosyltransferase [Psychroserpens sp.]|uniref:glycosyltransferase n=1 Tax=Psychroserpens sp. TaxID=2020870 RepID=UPI003CB19560